MTKDVDYDETSRTANNESDGDANPFSVKSGAIAGPYGRIGPAYAQAAKSDRSASTRYRGGSMTRPPKPTTSSKLKRLGPSAMLEGLGTLSTQQYEAKAASDSQNEATKWADAKDGV